MVKKLQWDSDFFNLKVGEINFEKNYKFENLLDYDLIYLVSKDDLQLKLEQFEHTFSETKVSFIKTLVIENRISEPIFKYEELDINKEDLYFLAYESGKQSRFLLDKKFEENHFKKLYQAWIDNSINKKFADDVLVYFEENQVKGFITYKINKETASVGLIAVNPNIQGKGIGAKLLKYLENLAFRKEIKEITIPTQLSNIQACNFYKKQGYSIKNKIHIQHYWKI